MSRLNIALTVDSVVLCHVNNNFKILLIKRKNDPFQGKWALPGGFVDEGEDLPEAAQRELLEETGLDIKEREQVKAFGKPGRDPRGRTVSVAFLSRIFCEENVKGNDDAAEARWFDVEDLPEMAFDHEEIIRAAKHHL